MAITTAVDIEVNASDTGGSVKSIKSQLREAKEEAIQLAQKFGENSVQANDAAKKVAVLKDRVEDLGLKIKGLNPDKFQRIATLTAGIGQGFVAAQGAMALFGSESEDLNKTMIKLQGAIALSQGLQGLKDTAQAFAGLGQAAVKAFNVIKLAIGSTGIGLIIVALGAAITALIVNWDKLTGAVDESTEAQKRHQASLADTKKSIEDLDDSIAAQESRARKIALERKNREGNETSANIQAKIDLMKDGLQKELAQQELNFAAKNVQLLEQGVTEKNREALNQKERQDIIDKYAKIEADKKKAADDAALDQVIQTAINEQNVRVKIAENEAKDKAGQDAYKLAQEQKLLDAKTAARAKAKEQLQKILNDELAAEREMQRLKYEAVTTGLNLISEMVSAFAGKSEEAQKRAFDIQKALSIATTIIETYAAASGAYRSQMAIPTPDAPVRAAIAAGIAIASGLARLAQIKKTEFNSTSVSAPVSAPYSAPNINQSVSQQRSIVGNATGSTGNQTQTNTVKVFVTETDISKAQNRTRTIERRATVR